MRTTLPVAETFYSIQGEGPSAGTPALFFRTSYCNLRCPGWGPAGSPQGCDTTAVWTHTWRELAPEDVVAYWEHRGWLRYLWPAFRAHLVVTGGEPLLWQRQLAPLLALLPSPFVEVETNGTLAPLSDFDRYIGRYNCSPKLSSAGNAPGRAYQTEVLQRLAADPRTVFKFVVQDAETDLYEILERFVEPFSIEPGRIWLMPEAADRQRLIERSGPVMDLAKRFGFCFSSRLHLIGWDQATGV